MGQQRVRFPPLPAAGCSLLGQQNFFFTDYQALVSLTTGGSRVATAILLLRSNETYHSYFPLMAGNYIQSPVPRRLQHVLASGRHKSPRRIAFINLPLALGFLAQLHLILWESWLLTSSFSVSFNFLNGRQFHSISCSAPAATCSRFGETQVTSSYRFINLLHTLGFLVQ